MAKAVTIANLDGPIVCERCVLADSALRRMRGLLGRKSLDSGHGILIRPAPAIHTWFMRFAIDAVFLDRESRVLRVAEHLKPWRLAGCRGASAVVELPAGECERIGLAAGDVVVVKPA